MKNKFKIIFSTYDDIKNPTYGGGGAIAIHEVAKRLIDIYDISVISWNHSGTRNETIEGVKYVRIGYSFINPKIAMALFQLILPALALTKQFDLWIESFAPPFTTSFLPLFTRKPVIGVTHMLAAEDMKRKYKISVKFIENAGLASYKYIVTTTQNLRSKVINIAAKANVAVITNGVNLPTDYTNEAKKKIILFLGRIEIDQKGIDLLLTVFQKFSQKAVSEYKLIIAGTGSKSDRVKLTELITALELTNNVQVVGRVDDDQKHALLTSSECMLVTSRYESFCMSALEALASGLPLICFDIEGLKWVPNDIAVKIKEYDTEAMADALNKSLNNNQEILNKVEKAKEFAKSYSWDTVANNYSNFLTEVLTHVK